jgi:diguanylate cyclase (GGDEF)-like protein
MNARQSTAFQWTRYLTPTDAVYIVSIAVGLFALVFLEEVPIRLIGACVVLLSGVFLLLNIQSRKREKVAWSRPNVSQSVELTKRVRTDPNGTTRIVFDDFAETFSGEHQQERRSEPIAENTRNGHNTTSSPQDKLTTEARSDRPAVHAVSDERGDDFSSVRVKRRVPASRSVVAEQNAPATSDERNTPDSERPAVPRVRHVALSLATLMDDSFEDDLVEPRREFTHILKGIMHILRSTMSARTATFFWYNADRSELVLEASISDVADSLRTQRKYPLGEDIISVIARDGQAQIVCDIQQSAECDLLPYYFQATGTRSFAGVPVFLNKVVVGVLTVDSADDDAYDEQTVGVLGQCGRLISMLVQSYTAKYDLQQNARTLETIVHFRRLLQRSDCTIGDIAQSLVSAATTVVEARAAGVVLFSPEHDRWELVAVTGDGMPPVGTPIELDGSAIAATLLDGTIVHCQHCQTPGKRYSAIEQRRDDGYFVAVPLRTSSENYGALFIETTQGRTSHQDIAALEIIGEHAGMFIAQLFLRDRVRHQALLDDATETYNIGAFERRLAEELERARDTGQHLCVALMQLDRYKALEQQPLACEQLIERIASLVRSVVKPYHVVGRLDSTVLGIILAGSDADKAHVLVEHIRKKIAGTPQTLEGRTVVVTVSVGIARAAVSDTPRTLLDHAAAALQQALRRSNVVVPYS